MEYVNLCKSLKSVSLLGPGPWTWSEKLDGMRVIWDGGMSRGIMSDKVGWARTGPKGPVMCTGLFSREGNPVQAPSWWLDKLGGCMRDGELWMGYEWRGELLSIVKQQVPDERWSRVKLHQYGNPNISFFNERVVRVRGSRVRFNKEYVSVDSRIFIQTDSEVVVRVVEHVGLPTTTDLDAVLLRGGEGLVIKDGRWRPERAGWYKLKPYDEMEVVVVGYTEGLGKYTGMLGAYICRHRDGVVHVSGMDDAERSMPRPIGSVIEVRYRGLSPTGVPCECRICPRIGD